MVSMVWWTLEHTHSLLEVFDHNLKHTRISKAQICNLVYCVTSCYVLECCVNVNSNVPSEYYTEREI